MISVNADCETPLGMQSGDVKASDVSASSTLMVPDEDYSPTQGRLNNKPSILSGVNFKGIVFVTVRHSTARHGTARHGTARHGTARHETPRHGTVEHSTAQ